MREVVGVFAPNDFPQSRWAYNIFSCDDAFDAASQENDLLLVDAHGWEDPARGWVMELLDGIVVIENWVKEQPENKVFLNVCNPAGTRIRPRSGQTVIFSLSVTKASMASLYRTEKG